MLSDSLMDVMGDILEAIERYDYAQDWKNELEESLSNLYVIVCSLDTGKTITANDELVRSTVKKMLLKAYRTHKFISSFSSA